MTKVLKQEWIYPDTTAEEHYEAQSIAASKGQKVTEQATPAHKGPIPMPAEYQ